MRTIRIALVMAFAAAAPLAAQSQQPHGFDISFGMGGGSAGVTGGTNRETSPAGYLRMGASVRPNLVIAGELNGWSKSQSGTTFTIGTVNAIAQYYPVMNNGLYVLGGMGYGTMQAKADVAGTTTTDNANGFGYQVGAGYDWRLTPSFSLTPYAGYFATSGGKFSDGTKMNGNVFQFGLGFTWR